jgi:GAF domain-containing protein
VGLPKSNIHRLTIVALLAGFSLAALVVGFVRLAAGLPPLGSLADLLAALLVGGLLSIALVVSLRLALRHAAHELRHAATELSGSSLTFPPARNDDVLATMRRTLAVAIDAVPRSASLSPLAETLSAAVDAPTVLDCAATLLARHLPVQGAALLVVDGERGALRPIAAWGSATLATELCLDLDQSALGRALLERRELCYNGLQIRELLPLAGDSTALSFFCLPLLAGGQLFGSLCLLAHGDDVRMNVEQRAFARAVASLLTLAIQSSTQRRRLAREQDRLAAFEELGGLLVSSQRIERALEHVLRAAARVTDSAHGSLLLLAPDERNVRFRITLREGDLLPLSLSVAPILKHGLAGWALRERRADLIEDTASDRRWLPVPGLDQMRAALVVPLLYGERVLGVLTLADPQPRHYSQRSLALASALASYAVTILARMQYDDLTAPGHIGLARQFFEDRIAPAGLLGLLGDDVALARALLPQTHDGVALAIGLRGFDRLSAQLSAALLSEHVFTPYYAALRAIAHEYHAYLSWRDDGGLWLIFGFPEAVGDLRAQALLAAQAVQSSARRLRGRWRTQLRREISLSAGLAAGPILFAAVGTGPSATLTMSGPALREAARLQRLARSDEVLVDATLIAVGDQTAPATLEALMPLDDNTAGPQRPIFRLVTSSG